MENPSVYIADRSYGKWDSADPDFDENALSLKAKSGIEEKLHFSMKCTNIGMGADLPTFFLDIFQNNKEILALLVLFFSGQKIKQNFEAWISIFNTIYKRCSGLLVYFNREAALIFGLAKLQSKYRQEFSTLKLIRYLALDVRQLDMGADDFQTLIGQNKYSNISTLQQIDESISYTCHLFEVEIDGQLYVFAVYKDRFFLAPRV